MASKTPLTDGTRFALLDGAIGQCTDVIGAVNLLHRLLAPHDHVVLDEQELTGLKYLLEQVSAELSGIGAVLAGEFERLQTPVL